MVTERDLRFAFHMDTGNMGFWDPNGWAEKVLWDGHPTSEYGRWLEERAGNQGWLQRAFMFENRFAPTYRSSYKKKDKYSWRSGWSYRDINMEVYHKDYIFWLEERILNKKPEIVKDILHI